MTTTNGAPRLPADATIANHCIHLIIVHTGCGVPFR
jgi:hypothetical protein